MKNQIISSLLIIFLFIGCSENNSIEPIATLDSELQAKIVGTWSSDYLTISYDANGTFLKTVNYIYADNSLNQEQAETIKGTYNIRKGILMYNISEWKVTNTSPNNLEEHHKTMHGFQINKMYRMNIVNNSTNQLSLIASIPDFKIQFEGDLMYFYPLDILTSNGTNNEGIWGEWFTTQWAIGRSSNSQNSILLGKLEWIYKFNKDSMTVTYGSKFQMDSSGTYNFQTDKVKYSLPNLSWGEYYNKTIEINDGQIYMYEKLKTSPMPLKKMK
ncbi:MAG: hypothetical protein WCZ90_09080 [Melioribacteraceae bacterium]